MTVAKALPSKEQARRGGALAVDNAHALFASAELAAEAGTFGLAAALAVLAVEEAAKGRALLGWALAKETGETFRLNDAEFRRCSIEATS